MDFLSRLTNWLYSHLTEKKSDDEINHHQNNNQQDYSSNLIEIRHNIIEAIVKDLKMFKCNDVSQRLTLVIYILDDTIYNGLGVEYDMDGFKNAIEERITTELGITFKSINISNKKPETPQTINRTQTKGLEFLFYKVENESTFAVVTAMKGYGSIMGDNVRLQPIPNKVYNIGRGRNVRTSNHMFRTNDIAFDDNEKCEDYEKNMHVSRCHAHIQYKKEIGFVLYVDEGGTRICGKRTRILRPTESKPIDLDSDTSNFIPLKDGDIIELGKEALIKYCYT